MSKAGKVVSGEIAAQVKGERLWDRLMALAEFGASDGGAINRQALSDRGDSRARPGGEMGRSPRP